MSTFSGTFIFNERDHILSWIATAEHVIDRCGLSIELLVGNKAINLKKKMIDVVAHAVVISHLFEKKNGFLLEQKLVSIEVTFIYFYVMLDFAGVVIV